MNNCLRSSWELHVHVQCSTCNLTRKSSRHKRWSVFDERIWKQYVYTGSIILHYPDIFYLTPDMVSVVHVCDVAHRPLVTSIQNILFSSALYLKGVQFFKFNPSNVHKRLHLLSWLLTLLFMFPSLKKSCRRNSALKIEHPFPAALCGYRYTCFF